MISKVFFILTFIISGTEVCSNKSPCKCVLSDNEVIDISTVGLVDFPRFYEIKGSAVNDTHLYSYNPCFSFSSPAHQHTIQKNGNKPCVDAAACIRSPGGNNGDLPEELLIGVQSEGKFGVSSDDNSTYINYTVPGMKRTLMVKLNCSKTSEQHQLTIETDETKIPNLVIMTLSSKCACPNLCSSSTPDPPSDDGMSTGSKLLIAFFTIVLAYFLIGMGWNLFNGAQGLELVPNYEFWNELPKLIVEGVAFTCSCFGRRTAYGEV